MTIKYKMRGKTRKKIRKYKRKSKYNRSRKIFLKKGVKKSANEYWKPGRFLGKTWWMPCSMKSGWWLLDTINYGIPW